VDILTNDAFITKNMSKLKNKLMYIHTKTLWKIYVDFMPQCKLFIRFLKEQKFFMEFFRIVREDGIPEWLNNDDGTIDITETTIMRDIIFSTVDLDDPKLEKLDMIWVKEIKKYNTDEMKNEINRFFTIAEKYHVKII